MDAHRRIPNLQLQALRQLRQSSLGGAVNGVLVCRAMVRPSAKHVEHMAALRLRNHQPHCSAAAQQRPRQVAGHHLDDGLRARVDQGRVAVAIAPGIVHPQIAAAHHIACRIHQGIHVSWAGDVARDAVCSQVASVLPHTQLLDRRLHCSRAPAANHDLVTVC